jgi:hypothetical protein
VVAGDDQPFRGGGRDGATGVDFVCSGAEFLSQSHRYMERVGMRVQFVWSIWTAWL